MPPVASPAAKSPVITLPVVLSTLAASSISMPPMVCMSRIIDQSRGHARRNIEETHVVHHGRDKSGVYRCSVCEVRIREDDCASASAHVNSDRHARRKPLANASAVAPPALLR